jgi:hypothetical protein
VYVSNFDYTAIADYNFFGLPVLVQLVTEVAVNNSKRMLERHNNIQHSTTSELSCLYYCIVGNNHNTHLEIHFF